MPKGKKKKNNKSYKDANPMRPDKKEGRDKNYKNENPYSKKPKKGKMSGKAKNPMKGG
jgi:hypothetical protein